MYIVYNKYGCIFTFVSLTTQRNQLEPTHVIILFKFVNSTSVIILGTR